MEKCLSIKEEYFEEDKSFKRKKLEPQISPFKNNYRLDGSSIYNEHNKNEINIFITSDVTKKKKKSNIVKK